MYIDANDFYLIDLSITTASGTKIIDMRHNRLVHTVMEPVQFLCVPGHIRIVARGTPEYAPEWVEERIYNQFALHGEEYNPTEEVILLDLEVVRPSQVKLCCYCAATDGGPGRHGRGGSHGRSRGRGNKSRTCDSWGHSAGSDTVFDRAIYGLEEEIQQLSLCAGGERRGIMRKTEDSQALFWSTLLSVATVRVDTGRCLARWERRRRGGFARK